MVDEPAEPSCPRWVGAAGFTNFSQQWCTRSSGFHTVRSGTVAAIAFISGFLELKMNGKISGPGIWDVTLLGWRWLYEPQPISHQQVGLGFPHCAGRSRPGGSQFSSLICRSCKCMEGFLIREWDIILPGGDAGSTNPSQSAFRPKIMVRNRKWIFHTFAGFFSQGR